MSQGNLAKLVASSRRKLFAARIQAEIHGRILPHVNGSTDHGYPFHSADEMAARAAEKSLDAQSLLRLIDRAASKMPRAEGDAFKYLAYRDLNERMWEYVGFGAERVPRVSPANGTPVPA